jgi:hypothetical protein
MPVYKRIGVLVDESALKKTLGSLKFGDIALKTFDDVHLEDLQFWTSGHLIHIQATNGVLSIRDKREAEIQGTTVRDQLPNPSAKEITKNIEQQLKSFGISLAGYGKVVIGTTES